MKEKVTKQSWGQTKGKMVKNHEFPNFAEAIRFINQVAQEAEKMNHHPDIKLYKYKHVKITLITRSQGKITHKDTKLAKQIDKLYATFLD